MMTIVDVATIREDGTLKLPQQALDALGTREVRLEIDEGRMVIEPRKRKLHEIEDREERAAAYQAFKAKIMRPGGGDLPSTRSELNDVVYD